MAKMKRRKRWNRGMQIFSNTKPSRTGGVN